MCKRPKCMESFMRKYELDKSTGELIWEENTPKLQYSPEFTYWYERIYLQSPRLCSLQYDDDKMWEAWKAAKQLGVRDVEL